MRKTILSLSAAAMALTGATIVYAQSGNAADANGDGNLTLAEMTAKADAQFARMDVNGDGVVNQADRDAREAQMFAKADTNGDGQLTPEEMKAAHEARKERWEARREANADKREDRMAQRFAKADTDNSGGLSQAELDAMHSARGKHEGPGGERGEGKHRRGMHRGGPGGEHGGMGMMIMRMADANGDKSLTRAELDAAVAAHFAKMDTDHDGVVTKAERGAFHKQMRQQWQQKRAERAQG